MILATSTASLPSTIPDASTMYHWCLMSDGVAVYVFIWFDRASSRTRDFRIGSGGLFPRPYTDLGQARKLRTASGLVNLQQPRDNGGAPARFYASLYSTGHRRT